MVFGISTGIRSRRIALHFEINALVVHAVGVLLVQQGDITTEVNILLGKSNPDVFYIKQLSDYKNHVGHSLDLFQRREFELLPNLTQHRPAPRALLIAYDYVMPVNKSVSSCG